MSSCLQMTSLTARKNTFTIFSGMNDVYIEKAASVRAVECIVRYKFNPVKTKYKGKGAGKKEMDRLYLKWGYHR